MTPWVTRLVIANVLMYLISLAAPAIVHALMLVPALVLSRPWTLATYMFLHGGLWHLLFNMLGLYFFGPRLEVELGGRDFLLLYFISGIGGALFSFLTPFSAIIGASGAVFGVLAGFARYWPRERIYLWAIVPIEARWLVLIMTGLSLLGGFGVAGEGGIAHFAHLGGFAGGFLYLLVRDRNPRREAFKLKMKSPSVSASNVQRWMEIDGAGLHEVNRGELDRIKDKITAHGVESLTPTEREFLDRFSTG
jgi:membrane associated rhomboid family serine protease